MKRFAILLAAAISLASCSTPPPKPTRPMDLCRPTTAAQAVDRAVLERSLVQAQIFSNTTYGADCVVCAEVMEANNDSVQLHITSPFEDILINTSATIRVSARDGTVLKTALYHSCHARRKS